MNIHELTLNPLSVSQRVGYNVLINNHSPFIPRS